MDTPTADRLPPATWIDAIADSDDDLAAGRVVPLDTVLTMLDEAVREAEAKQAVSAAT